MSEASNMHAEPCTEIEARAADFLQRRRFWDWSADDQAALDVWLKESVLHRVAFLRLEAGLERVERLAVLQSETPAPRARLMPMILRIAAVFAVVAVGGIAGTYYFGHARDRLYSTPMGGHESVRFADGSEIELNTATSIRARMTSEERIVWLEKGEAFFHIRHDPLHPFVVMVGNHRVTDLGTEFLVKSGPKQLQVTVVQGQVSFDTPDSLSRSQAVLLTPGDVATAAAGKVSIATVSTRALNDELSWRHGMLVFDNATLEDAAREFNRYNRDKLVVADPAAASMTIVGTFRTSDMKVFAQATRDALGLSIKQSGNNIVISSLPQKARH